MNDSGPSDTQIAERLRELPPVEADTALLARLDALAVESRRRADSPARRWSLAALLLIATAVSLLMLPRWFQTVGQKPQPVASRIPNTSRVSNELSDLSQLIARSAVLDQVNATLPDRQRVMNLRDAGRITAIEARVARLDLVLASPSVSGSAREQLWQQRVGLMDDLVELRSGQGAQQWL